MSTTRVWSHRLDVGRLLHLHSGWQNVNAVINRNCSKTRTRGKEKSAFVFLVNLFSYSIYSIYHPKERRGWIWRSGTRQERLMSATLDSPAPGCLSFLRTPKLLRLGTARQNSIPEKSLPDRKVPQAVRSPLKQFTTTTSGSSSLHPSL